MKKILLGAALALSLPTLADEGQWQPSQLLELNEQLQDLGIQVPTHELADPLAFPLNAVISMGYCSGAFVSPDGLIATNHHCAYGIIQHNSSAQQNLIEEGFNAKDHGQELSGGPSERIYITTAIEDVTAKLTGELAADLGGKARFDAIENGKKALVAQCEVDDFTRCQIASFHGGLSYQMITQTMLKDVRLVYAPPGSIGVFGGDIDNFEWPRHTGDFTLIRAYVGKDGKPANFSPDNVPYQPKSHLKVNRAGVVHKDPIILAGYPGRTSRYRLASEVAFARDWLYPTQVAGYEKMLDTIAAFDDTQIQVTYASRKASVNNRLKKLKGLLDGFRQTDIQAIKASQEQALGQWLHKQNQVGHQQELETLLGQARSTWQQHFFQEKARQSDLLATAITLYRNALEAQKPDAERKLGYQLRDQEMLKGRLQRLDSRFDARVDKALWQASLNDYLVSDYRDPEWDQLLPSPDQLAQYYDQTQLTNPKLRLAWMDAPARAFLASPDPFIQLAIKLMPLVIEEEAIAEQLDGQLSAIRPLYMEDIIAYNQAQGRPVYPDANSSLRVTFGQVDGYAPRDGSWNTPFTSVRGILAKDTGVAPFKAPAPLKAAAAEKRFGRYYRQSLSAPQSWTCQLLGCEQPKPFDSVPVNFLSSADTTGGNSGSPVMNARGELVGLNFDSTYESITKDWYFNPAITRAIHVDVRYMLWLMEEVYPAPQLLEEMTVVD